MQELDAITVLKTVITGVGATLIMDLWSMFQKHVLKISPLDYALVGRWILWIPRGKFWHHTIISTSRLSGEFFAGWVFHYLTGMIFALIPLALYGKPWFHEHTFSLSILTGLLTLAAPFLIMQPAFGFGVAASHTPRPWLARLLGLATHLAYGIGLFGSATIISSMF